MSVSGLACSYACLILHDDGIPITAEKIVQLVKAANVEIESYWPGLFASLAAKRNIEDIILNMGSVGGGAGAATAVSAPAAGAAAAANAPPPEEKKKKEEPQEESDEDMGFSLFD